MKINSKKVRQIHRWVGLLFSVSVLMSSGSGVLHNVMSRTQSPPPAARPSGSILPQDVKVSVAEALKYLPDPHAKLQAVSIRSIAGEPWYQFFIEGEKKITYVSANDGKVSDAQDEVYASEIASNYLGGKPVEKTDYLTSFNSEYINIFRILPVYRFDTDDGKGTRVYVSTMTGSITRHTDNQRQFEASVFSNFHKFMFIKNKDLRDGILTFMTFGIFSVAVLGIILFFMTRPSVRK
ncbi:MAG: hypothetical protein KBD53_10955 [Candidatus Omnitrophica bacterium]|nr:hypothetical protein [Candidatus Omnitrophota bacterium]